MTTNLAWILGSNSIIAKNISSNLLQSNYDITYFSRRFDSYKVGHIHLDFSSADNVYTCLKSQFLLARPSSVIFCQRYRPSTIVGDKSGLTDLDHCHQGLDVELSPLFSLFRLLQEEPSTVKTKPLSIVLLSSVAGIASSFDLPIYYHFLKAACVSLLTCLSTSLAKKHNARLNCVLFGEIQKYPLHEYTQSQQRQFSDIESFSGLSPCTPQDVANAVKFCASSDSRLLNGQLIKLDGGLFDLSIESYLRSS